MIRIVTGLGGRPVYCAFVFARCTLSQASVDTAPPKRFKLQDEAKAGFAGGLLGVLPVGFLERRHLLELVIGPGLRVDGHTDWLVLL